MSSNNPMDVELEFLLEMSRIEREELEALAARTNDEIVDQLEK